MRGKYSFDYKSFMINMLITVGIWLVAIFFVTSLLGEKVGADENKGFFGFEETWNYENIEAKFLKALGKDEIEFQTEEKTTVQTGEKIEITKEDLANLNDLEYLKNNFYIVDQRTDLLADDIKVEEFLAMDLSVDTESDGPKILIFHTHSQETFADSESVAEGVWGVGERLKELIEEKYGVEVLHHDGVYDFYEGRSAIIGAYERMEPDIRQVLRDNPSIEVVIDMHRDGVAEGTHLVEEIDGKQCAKVMFFNGLCRVYEDGVLTPIEGLQNTYLNENLALSFNLQLAANSLYPGLTRKVYLNAYRYSLHMKPKSIVLEVGAQTNTYEEALNAMEPLSEVLGNVLF